MSECQGLTPIFIGKVKIDVPLFLAPMAGITDLPFRLQAKRGGAGVVITEMVSSNACVYGSKRTLQKMSIDNKEHPAGIQLFGSDPDKLIRSAEMAADCGADFININLGCPVPKIIKSGAGFALMDDHEKIGSFFKKLVKGIKLPVTIKLRLGTTRNAKKYLLIGRIAYESGILAVILHCRLKEGKHNSEPDYTAVADLVKQIKIPVIANGGIDTPEIAYNVYKETNCAGLMIGQGAIGNPHIFSQIIDYFRKGRISDNKDKCCRLKYLEELLIDTFEYYKDEKSLFRLRKLLPFYSKGLPGISDFRKNFNMLLDYKEMIKLVRDQIRIRGS
ncbi:MAG: tRNA-dihydrouridine synthase [bacterium]